MADLAAIGLASAIIQFVDFGTKVLHRFYEFQKRAGEVPAVFHNLQLRLPLYLDSIKRIKAQVDDGEVHEDTQQALRPIVQNCFEQIEQLNDVLTKVSPAIGDSSWRRGTKALLSIGQESHIKEIEEALANNIPLLTLNQVARSATESKKVSAAVFMVPFERDSRFVGRRTVLDEVELKFRNQRRVALAGLGGVGKSQLAIEYCYMYRERNPKASVFWLHGSADRFLQAYREIARKMDIPLVNGDVLDLVTEWFNDAGSRQWLLIIDNADDASTFFESRSASTQGRRDLKPLARYLPHSNNGSILITTRDSRVGERLCNREKSIPVLPMKEAEAEALLRSKISEDAWAEGDARELIKELAYLPLAITQAAAFISENNETMPGYLRVLRLGDSDLQDLLSEDLEDPRRDPETENSVMRTWKISFDQILKAKPRAAEVLSLMAVLERTGVPEVLLRKTGESVTSFKTALGTLQAFSLITGDKEKASTFRMHRLVQLTTQKWLELRSELSDLKTEGLRVLSEHYPDPSPETQLTCEAFAPHAELVLSYPHSSDAAALYRANLLGRKCIFEWNMGRDAAAYVQAGEAFEIHSRLCSEDDPALLNDYNSMGVWLRSQGDVAQARGVLEKAAAGREMVLGITHKHTLESIQNLACVLADSDEFEAAETVLRRALEPLEKLCGSDARSTLFLNTTMAEIMLAKGDVDAAEMILRGAAQVFEKTYGSEDPDTLDSLMILALVLEQETKLEEAASLLQTVVTAQEKQLGPNNMRTVTCIILLAEELSKMSDNTASETLLRQALARAPRPLGQETPGSIRLLHQLGLVLQRQSKHQEAEYVYKRAVAAEAKMFGKAHINTLRSMTNLASSIEHQGPARYTEAERVYREALAELEKSPGGFINEKMLCRTSLRDLLKLQNRQEEAVSLMEWFDEEQVRKSSEEAERGSLRQVIFMTRRMPDTVPLHLRKLETQ
ncbi:hypothetical protein MMC30_009320 [Trapelia coarctata]|nr:hypothetical protein [Trapelia coarctata]